MSSDRPTSSDQPTSNDSRDETASPVDPKEAMRLALEKKNRSNHASAAAGPQGDQKVAGGPHGQAGGKRVFRRKSGG